MQGHGDVLWDRLWTCPGSRTSGAARHCSLILPFATASRGEGLRRGRSATYPSSAGLIETLQMPGLQLLAICWHFDLFPHHPSQPRLSNFCFFTSRLVSRVQIPSSRRAPSSGSDLLSRLCTHESNRPCGSLGCGADSTLCRNSSTWVGI